MSNNAFEDSVMSNTSVLLSSMKVNILNTKHSIIGLTTYFDDALILYQVKINEPNLHRVIRVSLYHCKIFITFPIHIQFQKITPAQSLSFRTSV